MALNKENLKQDIIQIMTDMMTREETSIEEFAERLSDSVDDYVKEATIVYTAGLVGYSGTPITGTFEGNLE